MSAGGFFHGRLPTNSGVSGFKLSWPRLEHQPLPLTCLPPRSGQPAHASAGFVLVALAVAARAASLVSGVFFVKLGMVNMPVAALRVWERRYQVVGPVKRPLCKDCMEGRDLCLVLACDGPGLVDEALSALVAARWQGCVRHVVSQGAQHRRQPAGRRVHRVWPDLA